MEGSHTVDGMTPEELTEVQRVHDVMLKAMDREIWQLAQFVVTRRDDQLFGEAEFTLLKEAMHDDPQAGHIRDVLAENYVNLADVLRRMNQQQTAAEAARQAHDPRLEYTVGGQK